MVINTGDTPITGVQISDPLLSSLAGPTESLSPPNDQLDVNEFWTYTGSYTVTQPVIDGNGVDASGQIDGDGDIDNLVTVSSYELPDESAEATVPIIPPENSCTLRAAMMEANAHPAAR